MIAENQSYRMSFTFVFFWLAAVSFPIFLGGFLLFHPAPSGQAYLSAYQPVLWAILALSTLAKFGWKFELHPQGLTGASVKLRKHYLPYSAIESVRIRHLLFLPFICLKGKSEAHLYIPAFLSKQNEFAVLLQALLQEYHPRLSQFE